MDNPYFIRRKSHWEFFKYSVTIHFHDPNRENDMIWCFKNINGENYYSGFDISTDNIWLSTMHFLYEADYIMFRLAMKSSIMSIV